CPAPVLLRRPVLADRGRRAPSRRRHPGKPPPSRGRRARAWSRGAPGMSGKARMDFETLVARGGRDVASASRPLTPPIYQTNVYVFEDMDTVQSVWESKKPGFVYGLSGAGTHAMLWTLVAARQ